MRWAIEWYDPSFGRWLLGGQFFQDYATANSWASEQYSTRSYRIVAFAVNRNQPLP